MDTKLVAGTRVTYRGEPATVTHEENNLYLIVFDEGEVPFGYGWKGAHGNGGELTLDPDRYYYWVYPTDLVVVSLPPLPPPKSGYNCVVCNGRNEYAQANLNQDRHICFSCKDSYAWKYQGEFI